MAVERCEVQWDSNTFLEVLVLKVPKLTQKASFFAEFDEKRRFS